jgi:hypothetical protein
VKALRFVQLRGIVANHADLRGIRDVVMIIVLRDNEFPICPFAESGFLGKKTLDGFPEDGHLTAWRQRIDRHVTIMVQLLELRGAEVHVAFPQILSSCGYRLQDACRR